MLGRLPIGLRRLLSFAAGSSVGLVIDLGGFLALASAGAPPWLSNCISSFTAVTAVYLLVTRYSFGAHRRMWTYVGFVAWYSFVILVSSTAIQLLTSWSGGGALQWKLASIPVTFAANYCFNLILFRRPSLPSPSPTTPISHST